MTAHGPEGRYGDEPLGALVAAAPRHLDVLIAREPSRFAALLGALEPEVAISGGFPLRIPTEALRVPRHGVVNGHPSLLPRLRGPNPIGWALRNGDDELGFTFHRMDEDFDTVEREYAEIDWSRPAEEVHRQVRAWWVAAVRDGPRGALAEFGGQRVRVVRTRLDDGEGGIRVECGDGPIWVLESVPA